MELFIGSFGHRYSDALQTYIGFTESAVDEAVNRAYEYEIDELKAYCDLEHDEAYPESECLMCNPDLVTSGSWRINRVSELGGLRNVINLVKECRENANGVTNLEAYFNI